MRSLWLTLIPVVVFNAPAAAQTSRIFNPWQQIREFLQLSDAQLQTITQTNEAYTRWSWEKQNRIQQVQSEIAVETAKSPLDPNALGLRYAEIEVNCREMKDRATQDRTKNLGGLSDVQKAKLAVLEEAVKLLPLVSAAQFANLAGPISSAPSPIIGGVIAAYGCQLPFPTGIRTGDFLPAPAGGILIPISPGRSVPINAIPRWFDRDTFVNGQGSQAAGASIQ